MKTYNTYKIGTAALAAVLVLGISSCAHHRKKPAVPPAPVSQPTAQATVLQAPKSLEGAWIKLTHHSTSPYESPDTEDSFWYYRKGKAYWYSAKDIRSPQEKANGYPTRPSSFRSTNLNNTHAVCYIDNLGREILGAELKYVPWGAKALLRIENLFGPHGSVFCRSIDEEGTPSEQPAIITLTSVRSGVYEGTVDGIYDATDLPLDVNPYRRAIDSITIYTK